MPSSLIHLCVAKEVAKQIPLKEEEFLYGNILPDYLAKKDYHKKAKLHFYDETIIGNIKKENVNLEKFLKTNQIYLTDSLGIGVYSHFITDFFWIKEFIKRHLVKQNERIYIKTKRGLIRNNRITVYNDYDRMANWIVDKYNLSVEFIKNIDYNGHFIQIYDLPQEKIYNTIKVYMERKRLEEWDIFSKEEVEEFIKQTSKEVIKKIKELKIEE